jgi:trigger factor
MKMQVSVETIQGLERRLTITIPGEEIAQEVQKRLKPLTQTARIAGFRPGKIPLSLIEKRFGAQVRHEVVEERVQSSLTEAVTQNQFRMIGNPTLELASEEGLPEGDLRYTATFAIYPEINLAPLGDIVVNRTEIVIEDTDVDAVIENLRHQRRIWTSAGERPAVSGDRIKMDFTASLADGTDFSGNTGNDVFMVIGEGKFIPGFEESLIGAVAGETRTVELTFPQDYHSTEVAGKLALFKVLVKSVESAQLPEVDEAFIHAYGVKEGTREALQEAVRNTMNQDITHKTWQLLKQQLQDALCQNNPMELPQKLVEEDLAQLRAGISGNEPPDLEDRARRRVALGFIIGEIARNQQLKVDDERVRTYVRALAEDYEKPEDVERFYFSDSNRLQEVEAVVLEDVVTEWLLGQVQVKVNQVPFSTLERIGQVRQAAQS